MAEAPDSTIFRTPPGGGARGPAEGLERPEGHPRTGCVFGENHSRKDSFKGYWSASGSCADGVAASMFRPDETISDTSPRPRGTSRRRAARLRWVWSVCALTAVLGCRAAERPLSGVLALTLEDAVPLECKSEPLHLGPHSWVTAEPLALAGYHNPYRDLRVEVVCRDGRWNRRCWAYAACMPGVDHAGKLVEAEVTATKARMVVEFHLRPRRAG